MGKATEDLRDYLVPSDLVNYEDPGIRALGTRLAAGCRSEVETARAVYQYVRDAIPHSFDIGAAEVSVTAADVLRNGHGICYAKSHLLAALLRSLGIPTGFCYQRLVFDDTDKQKLVIHGLNAIYLGSLGQWIRVDARGNKEGVEAEFDTETERLAFPVRPEWGEYDVPGIYHEPPPAVVKALAFSGDASQLITNLPTAIEE